MEGVLMSFLKKRKRKRKAMSPSNMMTWCHSGRCLLSWPQQWWLSCISREVVTHINLDKAQSKGCWQVRDQADNSGIATWDTACQTPRVDIPLVKPSLTIPTVWHVFLVHVCFRNNLSIYPLEHLPFAVITCIMSVSPNMISGTY